MFLQTEQHMFSYNMDCYPKAFTIYLQQLAKLKTVTQEAPENFKFLYVKQIFLKFSIRYQGPKLFNSLADEIVESATLRLFIVKLKSFFYLS